MLGRKTTFQKNYFSFPPAPSEGAATAFKVRAPCSPQAAPSPKPNDSISEIFSGRNLCNTLHGGRSIVHEESQWVMHHNDPPCALIRSTAPLFDSCDVTAINAWIIDDLCSYAHLFAIWDHVCGTAAAWVPSGGGASRYDEDYLLFLPRAYFEPEVFCAEYCILLLLLAPPLATDTGLPYRTSRN